jgi:hypothetical protein
MYQYWHKADVPRQSAICPLSGAKDYAMEAARRIKSKNPQSMVEVKDLHSGDVTAVALRPG